MSELQKIASTVSAWFSEIYYYCHPHYKIPLSHQAVRALQYVSLNEPVTVQQTADYLKSAQNTASEILRRLSDKGLVVRQRRSDDERIVEARLTQTGQQCLQEQTGLNLQKLEKCLSEMSEEERQEVLKGFHVLLKYVKEIE